MYVAPFFLVVWGREWRRRRERERERERELPRMTTCLDEGLTRVPMTCVLLSNLVDLLSLKTHTLVPSWKEAHDPFIDKLFGDFLASGGSSFTNRVNCVAWGFLSCFGGQMWENTTCIFTLFLDFLRNRRSSAFNRLVGRLTDPQEISDNDFCGKKL